MIAQETFQQLSNDTDLVQRILNDGANRLGIDGTGKQEIIDAWERIRSLAVMGWMTQEKIIVITDGESK